MFDSKDSETQQGSSTTYMVAENGFTDSELDRLVAYGDSLDLQKAVVGGDTKRLKDDARIRITRTAWMGMNQDIKWVYERMRAIVQGANMWGWGRANQSTKQSKT